MHVLACHSASAGVHGTVGAHVAGFELHSPVEAPAGCHRMSHDLKLLQCATTSSLHPPYMTLQRHDPYFIAATGWRNASSPPSQWLCTVDSAHYQDPPEPVRERGGYMLVTGKVGACGVSVTNIVLGSKYFQDLVALRKV